MNSSIEKTSLVEDTLTTAAFSQNPPKLQVERKSKWKVRLLVIGGLVAVVAVLAGIWIKNLKSMIAAGKSFVPPPETVTTTKVESGSWRSARAAVGSLVAVHGVTLGAELPGVIKEIHFESGTSVHKGDVLVRLDISTEEAQLESASADAALAKVSLERARQLRKTEANTVADLDAAEARAKQTDAAVATLRATIAKKTIRAPFDGRIAIRQVDLGQSVSPGTPLASLQSVDPIYAEFALPQQALADVKMGQQAQMRTDIFPGASWQGKVGTINSEVDVATRNVRIRATFPNADGRLRPGMFVNVEVVSGDVHPVLTIPATAVLYAPYGDSVFVAEDKAGHLAARQKFVRLGERRGDLIAVESGLEAGETVVSSGAFKLRNGMAIAVKNDLAPKVEIAPQPADK
jgi:membrane fusion protein (multidrug efflux system)